MGLHMQSYRMRYGLVIALAMVLLILATCAPPVGGLLEEYNAAVDYDQTVETDASLTKTCFQDLALKRGFLFASETNEHFGFTMFQMQGIGVEVIASNIGEADRLHIHIYRKAFLPRFSDEFYRALQQDVARCGTPSATPHMFG